MTPAEANPSVANFVTDHPVQGPTDEGLRAADCWWVQHVLPARPACVDCKGPIPMWAQRSLSVVRGESAGIGEQISLGGRRVTGFGNIVGIAAAGDPEIWTKLSPEQQTWIVTTLTKLNDLIVTATGTSCPTWGPSITAAGGCFQSWYNANYLPINPSAVQLRTDGVFDEDTLCALMLQAALNPPEFPAPFPDPEKRYCQAPTPAPAPAAEPEKKKLSTGAMVGVIGVAGVAAAGGIYYVVTRKGGGRSKKSRKGRRRH
jgi:hypothetical protein